MKAAKARSRAAKRRLKGGRPRIEGLDRTDEGRIRRTKEQGSKRTAETEREAMGTVIEMRQRVHKAPETTAKQPEWGYVLGRIFMDGKLGGGGIAKMRLEAGNRYAQDVSRYYGLTGIPFPSARAQDLFAVQGYAGDPDQSKVDAIRKATAKVMAMEGVLLSSKAGRNAASTVKNICVMDMDESRGWPEHMFVYLRCGLDSLIMSYGLSDGFSNN